MGVEEGEDAVGEAPGGVPGQLLPAPASVHAPEVQAEQHGGRIRDVEHVVARGVGPETVVIEVERRLRLVQRQVEQRLVPPQMVAEIVDLVFPVRLVLADPGDAFPGAALHFHDMGDGMDRPRIGGVYGHSPAAEILGPGVVADFLQPEGAHAEHIAVAGHALVPGRQHARGAVPVLGERAVIEMQVVREADREDVARVVEQDVLEAADGPGRVTRSPARQGVRMGAFARRRCKRACLFTGLRRPRAERAHAHQQEEIAPESMGHRHLGIGLERGLEQRPGLPPESQEVVQRRIQRGRRLVAGCGQFQTALVLSQSQPPENP